MLYQEEWKFATLEAGSHKRYRRRKESYYQSLWTI